MLQIHEPKTLRLTLFDKSAFDLEAPFLENIELNSVPKEVYLGDAPSDSVAYRSIPIHIVLLRLLPLMLSSKLLVVVAVDMVVVQERLWTAALAYFCVSLMSFKKNLNPT